MNPTQKNRTLVIKDPAKLEQYGFVKEGRDYVFYTGNKGKYGKPVWTIYIGQNRAPYVCSHGSITMEVICKMYADGIVAFEDNNQIEKHIESKKAKIKKYEEEIKRLKEKLKAL